jgi:hypothetical protein
MPLESESLSGSEQPQEQVELQHEGPGSQSREQNDDYPSPSPLLVEPTTEVDHDEATAFGSVVGEAGSQSQDYTYLASVSFLFKKIPLQSH